MTLSLEDKDAIRDLVAAYAHAVDRRRWDLIADLFHPDAIFAFGPVQGGWRDFIDQARAIIDPCIATHHQLGQILIVADGPDGAIAETYMTAMHTVPAGYPLPAVFPDRGETYAATIAGRYIDHLTRHQGRWRIMRRTGVYDWREYRTLGDADLAGLPQSARGTHDGSDPAWPVGTG